MRGKEGPAGACAARGAGMLLTSLRAGHFLALLSLKRLFHAPRGASWWRWCYPLAILPCSVHVQMCCIGSAQPFGASPPTPSREIRLRTATGLLHPAQLHSSQLWHGGQPYSQVISLWFPEMPVHTCSTGMQADRKPLGEYIQRFKWSSLLSSPAYYFP